MKCPHCNSPMNTVVEPDITTDVCAACGGIFLDKNELNVLATGAAGDIEYGALNKKAVGDRFPARTCPRCSGKEMKKVYLLFESDLIFDFCPGCEGFFLDKGEVEEMNAELIKAAAHQTAEEYRGYIDKRLVCLERVDYLDNIARISPGALGNFSSPCSVSYLRVSVYFDHPLNLGVKLESGQWTHRLKKSLRLFKTREIQTGNPAMDSEFFIRGDREEKIKRLFSQDDLCRHLLDFAQKKPSLVSKPGRLEILDPVINFSEGPYAGMEQYDVEEDPRRIVNALCELTGLVEKTMGRLNA